MEAERRAPDSSMARITPDRLVAAARNGWKRRAWLRSFMFKASQEFAGPWYENDIPTNRAGPTHPVNILATMVDTYMPSLVGHQWDVTVDAKMAGLEGDAKMRSLRLTHLVDEIKLAETDRRVVLDAMFAGEGIYNIGIKSGMEEIMVDGELYDFGQPFVKRIAPGDFISDPTSRHRMEDRWQAHRFIADREALLEAGIGDPERVKVLPTITMDQCLKDPNSPLVGMSDDDLISDDLVYLWHISIWDGKKSIVCVIPDLEGYDDFIVEPVEYMGPERGPYEFLSFNIVPDRATPVSMAMRLMDLHMAVRHVSSRIVEHIIETKRNIIYDSTTGQETAMRIKESEDDKPIPGDPDSVKEVTSGGLIDQFNKGYEVLMNMADAMGASLQQTAGRKGVADTATEASIIAGKSQGLIDAMNLPTSTARRNIIRRLSWYEDTAPARQQVYGVQVAPGMIIDVLYDPATREGDYGDFGYNARIRTATPMDSNTRLARLGQILQVLPPWLQFVGSMGGNVEAGLRLVSDDFPEMDNVFSTQAIMMAQQAMAQQMGTPGQAVGTRPVGKGPANAPTPMNAPQTQIGQVRSDAAAASTALPQM